ncbi:MAG: hypothetical protein OZ921_06090 [Sorangiineae bacterium]|nr:hypothetical protein [Polyangiaceae bacterium]MEB2322063.1 hypothetical protein [Sorangiineae bacterium]
MIWGAMRRTHTRSWRRAALVTMLFTASCSSSGGGGPSGAGGAAGGTAGTGASPGSGGAGGNGSGGDGGASGDDGAGTRFTFGLNLGYYGPGLSDLEASELGRAAGARSHRHKLTEPFLDEWGDDIHVSELSQMLAAGERDLVCFLIGMSAAHSNAPPGAADWEREHYSPKNLYQPIFDSQGEVNPDNYWAAFVARAVKTYRPYIHTWEVWNEPDQVGGNWQATQTWGETPPAASDLVWWNDSIFAYIRLLRITHEVVKKLDPEGKVTLGGIGYPSFLGALLRYTDEPTSGKVDAEHPKTGAAYFDLVSYHYYPVFSAVDSSGGARGLVQLRDELATELTRAGVSKPFIITESGAPRFAVDGKPGGTAFAANYLLKAMTLAQGAGIRRIDWFILGDSAAPGASTSAFDYMGLYGDLSSVTEPSAATITETGVAYRTLAEVLDGAASDPDATAALAASAHDTESVAFRTKDAQRAYVSWATGAPGEDATGTVSLPASGDATVYRWDYSRSKATEDAVPTAGAVTIEVTSAPSIVVVR